VLTEHLFGDLPLRIAVFSDTHLADTAEARAFLHGLVNNVIDPVDMILHAGDVVAPDLLDVFEEYTVHSVRGNMDPIAPGIPVKKVIDVQGFKIGLIHGWGPAEGIEERIYSEFSQCSLDCLVYGHSHVPVCHERHGVLFFNPGSATDRRNMSCHTIGLLEIDKKIRGTIFRLD
jgi:putative phosphoesterase